MPKFFGEQERQRFVWLSSAGQNTSSQSSWLKSQETVIKKQEKTANVLKTPNRRYIFENIQQSWTTTPYTCDNEQTILCGIQYILKAEDAKDFHKKTNSTQIFLKTITGSYFHMSSEMLFWRGIIVECMGRKSSSKWKEAHGRFCLVFQLIT